MATPGYVIKKGITFDVASAYKRAIEGAGGVCELIAEDAPTTTFEADLPNTEPLVIEAKKDAGDEIVLFQGDVSLIKRAWRIVQGDAIGTTQKFVFSGDKNGDVTLHRTDIHSAEEVKYGFGTKWVVKTNGGETYQFMAVNRSALRQTMLILTGQEALAQSAHKQPEISAVRNGTAWLAAFSPTISGMIAELVAYLVNGGVATHWSIVALIKIFILKLVLIHMFMRIDYFKLQANGYNVQQLGVSNPINIFTYLFSRAKAFGQGKAYAITWCVLFAIGVLYLFA